MSIQFVSQATASFERFEDFVKWASPGGGAGIDNAAEGYDPDDPWFDWSSRFSTSPGQAAPRTIFTRAENLGGTARALTRPKNGSKPIVLKSDFLIGAGKFLHFAKAYLNVLAHLKGVRTPLKSTVHALIALDFALRAFSKSDEAELGRLSMAVFMLAAEKLKSSFGAGRAYDAGQELELLAGLLQDGFRSKSLDLTGMGFRLLSGKSFVFVSDIPQKDSAALHPTNPEREAENVGKRLTNEVVACVGQAYIQSAQRFGERSLEAAMGATAALPFTSVSMRISDLQNLRVDLLHFDEDSDRWKISVYRPKLDKDQILRIPRILGSHVVEMITRIREFTQDSRDAFKFYEEKFGDKFESINELYIPEKYRPFFALEWFRRLDMPRGDGTFSENRKGTPGVMQVLRVQWGIDSPRDYLVVGGNRKRTKEHSCKFLELETIKAYAKQSGGSIAVPGPQKIWISEKYFELNMAPSMTSDEKQAVRRKFEVGGRILVAFSKVSEIRAKLLSNFKERNYPYWPYASSDRRLKLSECLFAMPSLRAGRGGRTPGQGVHWWLPTLVSDSTLRQWIGGSSALPAPTLFRILDIRLPSGEFPRFDIHETRKRFQTNALLAGVSLTLIDEQSGRKTGKQSAHYDRRTVAERVKGSMDCFDPNDNFQVFGHVAEEARQINIVDRRSYLYLNAAPKQLTEVGGCSTDWSMNPCPEHGACMSCGSSVWRKGDQERIPRIRYLKEYSLRMIGKADELIAQGAAPEPILRHKKQHHDVLDRCEEIFAAEANNEIPIGSLVTFRGAPGRVSTTELASRLREENLSRRHLDGV